MKRTEGFFLSKSLVKKSIKRRRFGAAVGWFFLAVAICIGSGILQKQIFAKELNANITVDEISFRNNANAPVDIEVVPASGAENPTGTIDDFAVKLAHNIPTSISFKVDIELINGHTIESGDTLVIQTNTHNTGNAIDLALDAATETDLVNSNNQVIGTFRVSNHNVIITFNDVLEGHTILNDLAFNLPNIARAESTGKERIGSIVIGDKRVFFGIQKKPLISLIDSVYTGARTNNRVFWETRVGSDLVNTLSRSRGTEGSPVNTYIEQDFPGAIGIDMLYVRDYYRVPMSLEDGSIMSGSAVSGGVGGDYLGNYTLISKNPNESYNSFKSRVLSQHSQYGIYEYDGGIKVIFNYGKLGQDTNFVSANKWADRAAQLMIEQQYFDDSEFQELRDYFLDCFGDNSVINQFPGPVYDANVYYPVAIEDTTVTTTVIVNYDGVEKLLSREAVLTGLYSQADVPLNSILLNVINKDGHLIPGGKFKLQVQQNDGTFADSGTVVDGGTNGILLFEDLPAGVYRVVEVEAPEGYSLEHSEGYDEDEGFVFSVNGEVPEISTEIIRITIVNDKAPEEPIGPIEPEEPEGPDDSEETVDDVVVPDTGNNVNMERGSVLSQASSIIAGTLCLLVSAYVFVIRRR